MSLHEQAQHPERRLRSLGWQGQLDQANRPEAVLTVARDYLAQVSPEEVAQLPEDCRPQRLVDSDDVAAYALELARRQASPDAPEVLHKLAAFFSDASTRLSQILAETSFVDSDQEATR